MSSQHCFQTFYPHIHLILAWTRILVQSHRDSTQEDYAPSPANDITILSVQVIEWRD